MDGTRGPHLGSGGDVVGDMVGATGRERKESAAVSEKSKRTGTLKIPATTELEFDWKTLTFSPLCLAISCASAASRTS